jgi:mannose-6-phosphate isomerase-like protein (cupin superfamily)
MDAQNLREAVSGLGEVEFKALFSFNDGSVGVFWAASGVSPWERHPTDEELLYVIEGRVVIEVLTDTGSVDVPVAEGSAFVVPRNHWHRHKHDGVVSEMYVTPGASEMSVADDPRLQAQG